MEAKAGNSDLTGVPLDINLEALKDRIFNTINVEADKFIVIYKGREILNGSDLKENGFKDGDDIKVILRDDIST